MMTKRKTMMMKSRKSSMILAFIHGAYMMVVLKMYAKCFQSSTKSRWKHFKAIPKNRSQMWLD